MLYSKSDQSVQMMTMSVSDCHPQCQSRDMERKIKEDFEELHQLLRIEEVKRLALLREEEDQKIRIMQLVTEMSRDTFSLSDTVKEIEELGADNLFLKVITDLRKGLVHAK